MVSDLKNWNQKIEELHGVGDKLGLGIEEGIIEVVAALNLNEVKTTQSCEGHLDRALAYPWVQIGSEKSENIDQKREQAYLLRKKLQETGVDSKEDLKQIHKLEDEVDVLVGEALKRPIGLLVDFYKEKGGGEDNERLVVVDFADGGRLQSQGASLQITRLSEDKKSKLEIYQSEMKRFGEYLKGLYLSR